MMMMMMMNIQYRESFKVSISCKLCLLYTFFDNFLGEK